MSLCRTCKFWSVRPGAIGAGNCLNIDVSLRLFSPQPLITTQDFGCLFHQLGKCEANIMSDEQEENTVEEFVKDQYPQLTL